MSYKGLTCYINIEEQEEYIEDAKNKKASSEEICGVNQLKKKRKKVIYSIVKFDTIKGR